MYTEAHNNGTYVYYCYMSLLLSHALENISNMHQCYQNVKTIDTNNQKVSKFL